MSWSLRRRASTEVISVDFAEWQGSVYRVAYYRDMGATSSGQKQLDWSEFDEVAGWVKAGPAQKPPGIQSRYPLRKTLARAESALRDDS